MALAASTILAGCSSVWSEEVVRAPQLTPAPSASATPYDRTVAAQAACVAVTKDQLGDFENAAGIGGALKYTKGVLVKANDQWWVAALHTEVYANDLGLTRANVPVTALWAITDAALDPDGLDSQIRYNRLSESADNPVALKAAGCLKKRLAG